jgi:hypothetical protein
MKKYFVAGFLIVSGLAYAAAEPQGNTKPQEKAECVNLALAIMAKSFDHYPCVKYGRVELSADPADYVDCSYVSRFRLWQLNRKLTRAKAVIKSDTGNLEQCIRQSPQQAHDPAVTEALMQLSRRNNENLSSFHGLGTCRIWATRR